MRFNIIIFTAILIGMYSCKPSSKTIKDNMEEEKTTASGLKYKYIKKGDGAMPQNGDRVEVHYTGRLANDTIFDSSVKRNQPFSFKLGAGQVIKGWDEGVAMMKIGDKILFTLPPEIAYGANGAGGVIGPNETLFFEVELLNIYPAAKPFNVDGKDTITTESGLKYIKLNETSGVKAQNNKTVSVHYSGYLEDGTMFDSSVDRGNPIDFPLGQGRVIKGWDEGIGYLNVGEKARLIIPHDIAYGDAGSPPVIPPKATLIFDVELMEVK